MAEEEWSPEEEDGQQRSSHQVGGGRGKGGVVTKCEGEGQNKSKRERREEGGKSE